MFKIMRDEHGMYIIVNKKTGVPLRGYVQEKYALEEIERLNRKQPYTPNRNWQQQWIYHGFNK